MIKLAEGLYFVRNFADIDFIPNPANKFQVIGFFEFPLILEVSATCERMSRIHNFKNMDVSKTTTQGKNLVARLGCERFYLTDGKGELPYIVRYNGEREPLQVEHTTEFDGDIEYVEAGPYVEQVISLLDDPGIICYKRGNELDVYLYDGNWKVATVEV